MQRTPTAFLFANNFDAAELERAATAAAAAPAALPPPAPMFEQADLDAATARGFDDGFARGRAAAEEERAAGVAATLERIAALLADAAAAAERVAEDSATAMVEMLVEALRVGYPSLRARYGDAEIRGMVRKLRPALERETEVTIHVHPMHVAGVEAELAAMRPPARRRIVIEPLDTMPPGDAIVEWPQGAAIREADAIWASIAEVLTEVELLPATAEPTTELRALPEPATAEVK